MDLFLLSYIWALELELLDKSLEFAKRLHKRFFKLPSTLVKRSQKSLGEGICYCGNKSQV